jgi:hypothetical protein
VLRLYVQGRLVRALRGEFWAELEKQKVPPAYSRAEDCARSLDDFRDDEEFSFGKKTQAGMPVPQNATAQPGRLRSTTLDF